MNDSTANPQTEEEEKGLSHLNPVEARIVGCLIEKQATTPDVYPLTVNAITLACNQKTNREPLMELELGEVGHSMRQLENKGLVRVVDSSRTLRYEHCVEKIYYVTPPQRALLAVMLLRGPQTLSELFTRTERMEKFSTMGDMQYVLERMLERSPALVARLPRSGGQREDRYMHLLSGSLSIEQTAALMSTSPSVSSRADLEERIFRLETIVTELKNQLSELQEQLGITKNP